MEGGNIIQSHLGGRNMKRGKGGNLIGRKGKENGRKGKRKREMVNEMMVAKRGIIMQKGE